MPRDTAMPPGRPASPRKSSSVIMMAALMDLLVIVPLTYWLLHGLGLIIAGGLLSDASPGPSTLPQPEAVI